MKLFDEYREILRTPGHARTATVATFVAWGVAAIWGWFFVEPNVLRDSQSARDFVKFATAVFPWLEEIKHLGPQAEKGLFLHSTYFFLLIPLGIVSTLVTSNRSKVKKALADTSILHLLVEVAFCFFAGALIIHWYYSLSGLSVENLHRTDYSFAVSTVTVPVVAPFFIYFFWSTTTAGFCSSYHVLRKVIHTTSHHA